MSLTRRSLAIGLAALVATTGGCSDEPTASGDRDAGTWRTWVLPSSSALRVPPPPRTGSRGARADTEQLEALAERRTPPLLATARREARRLAVQPWVEAALERVAHGTVKDPPSASRAYALVSVAMYDAAVAAWHWKRFYRRSPPRGAGEALPGQPGPSYPSDRAAIAGAAARVLGYAFPEYPAARWQLMARRIADLEVTAGASFPSDVRAGLALGRRVGDAVIARARKDGYTRRWRGRRPRGPAHWEPPPGSLARPTQPLAGRWRTWVLGSGRRFRPPPPPPFGSARFLAEAREVLEIGRHLTPRQKRIATYWSAGQGTGLPPGFWNEVALEYARHAGFSTPRVTRVFALLNVALADAGVAAWDAKYAYWSPRPVNAIRDLGLDRRWKSFLPTPTFPSYVSGHSTYSAAAAEVLAHLFPDAADYVRYKAGEAGLSRIYGGIHFRADNTAGLRLGRQIGRLVVRRAERDGAEP
jgi:membrane-associated phospholipid phosphatase